MVLCWVKVFFFHFIILSGNTVCLQVAACQENNKTNNNQKKTNNHKTHNCVIHSSTHTHECTYVNFLNLSNQTLLSLDSAPVRMKRARVCVGWSDKFYNNYVTFRRKSNIFTSFPLEHKCDFEPSFVDSAQNIHSEVSEVRLMWCLTLFALSDHVVLALRRMDCQKDSKCWCQPLFVSFLLWRNKTKYWCLPVVVFEMKMSLMLLFFIFCGM